MRHRSFSNFPLLDMIRVSAGQEVRIGSLGLMPDFSKTGAVCPYVLRRCGKFIGASDYILNKLGNAQG